MGLTWNLAPPHAQKTDGCLAHKGLSAVPTKNFFFFFFYAAPLDVICSYNGAAHLAPMR